MYRKFKELCDKKGVTPYRVSKDTGVSAVTLSQWKHGDSKPGVDNLKKLADYFGVTIEYLITDKDE